MFTGDPRNVEDAVRQVSDQASFVQHLLIDTLGWPIDDAVDDIEDLTFEWSADELRAQGLDQHIVDGTVRQIRPFPGNPWGVFLIEFKNPDVFTTNRGMTGTLRRVLRGLVPSKRRASHLASFKRDNLLFICNHNYEYYRFAHFKAPKTDRSVAPLATFGWAPGDPIRTVCEFNLCALAWPDVEPEESGWLTLWSQAFDVEKVTKRFYQDYADVFSQVESYIGEQNEVEGDELRLFTQALFNRLMFLRFIERKGWLEIDGRSDYLRALYEDGPLAGASFYRSRLSPLFFEALAVERKQDSGVVGSVPFLNGGLFERSALDESIADVPDAAFAPIIGNDGLFYRYNFTVEESTPLDVDVAVDPEMLGKVFEELVTGRHATGSYYTPRPVVSFMCREALKGVLSHKTNASEKALTLLVDRHEITTLTDTHASQILKALDDLRAVDPACGSGAYLLGLMHEMISIYRLLYSEKLVKDARSLYELKLRIISQNLYGVDIDPFATNIAMLRLWLSLAVESDEPVPLPNLDFKIETGDSLLAPDPHDMPDLFRGLLVAEANTLVNVKNQFLVAHGKDKEDYRQLIAQTEQRLRARMQEHHGEGVVDWRIQFAEVFAFGNRGFDIVLANPPYIDSERMTKTNAEMRKLIQHSYSFTKGNWDIYIAFFEMGFRLLGNRGVLTFITPDKWISKPFGDAMRLATTDKILCILNAGRSIFESAKVDAIVTVFTNQRQSHLRVCDFAGGNVAVKRVVEKDVLKAPYAYDWLFSDFVDLLEKLDASHASFSRYGTCENACATSDAYKLKEFIEEELSTQRPSDQLRIINTGTIGKYVSKWGQRKMVYLGERFDRPVVDRKRFLDAFKKSYGRKAVTPKIIAKGLNLLDACLDSDGTVIPGKSTLVITADSMDRLKALLCIVNSRVAFFYLKQKYPASSYNQGTTFTKAMINDLPVPEITAEDWEWLTSTADRVITTKQANPDADSGALEKEMNQVVYELYHLTPDEIAIIEENSR